MYLIKDVIKIIPLFNPKNNIFIFLTFKLSLFFYSTSGNYFWRYGVLKTRNPMLISISGHHSLIALPDFEDNLIFAIYFSILFLLNNICLGIVLYKDVCLMIDRTFLLNLKRSKQVSVA